ncbi:MAG: hypothetical protein EX269_16985 [Acidimicrobiales bacterium]|nr:MAG: hypothetical protein EX269_16985 [Acidimicrobiales bacterium]
MTGVTWDERKEGWWLASNGRWYAPDSYPRGWNMSALPPAPGQVETGAASQVLRRLRGALDIAEASPATMPATLADTRDTPPASPPPQARQSRPSDSGTPPPRRAPTPPSAQAQNAAARAKRERQVASATVSSSSTHKSRLPSAPPAPAQLPRATSRPPSPPARRKAPPPPQNVVAGDLGSVFGAARAKIEKAINEAAEQR